MNRASSMSHADRSSRRKVRSAAAALFACIATAGPSALVLDPESVPPAVSAAFETITEADVRAEIHVLAASALEGRDSPSPGLTRAAEHVAARLASAGFTGAGDAGAFILPFHRSFPAPDPAGCALARLGGGGSADGDAGAGADAEDDAPFVLGVDFVPAPSTGGTAQGRAVILGFGIEDAGERYDDVPSNLSGKIAVIVSGEPRHRSRFEGPDDTTSAADLYAKLEDIRGAGAEGVLVVRRPPPPGADGIEHAEDAAPGEPLFGFRHTWASWATEAMPTPRPADMPVLEITPAAARRLLGVDALEFVADVDAKGKAPRPLDTGRDVRLAAATLVQSLPVPNVVGVFRGSDPELADEYVVLGAHLDHIGVDTRGRIGFGADDNASGVSALLEAATALAAARPRRSILACAFGAEEDGLLGSRALVAEPPVPLAAMVVMLNMDMLGRGETKEVAVLGVPENPSLEKVLDQARRLLPTKVGKIVTGQGQHLFARSDHFPFHEAGVPTLFFFEGLPESRNADYHTWRDTVDQLDMDKITRTARLVFTTAWLLADDDERPPAPK